MQGKIAMEEHFGAPEFAVAPPLPPGEFSERMFDTDEVRLREMDETGIELAAISLTSPGVQAEVDPGRAVELAAHANDLLAATVARHPDRYVGFAAVPLQQVERGIAELERALALPGFAGAMLNGYTSTADPEHGEYYDDRKFDPFWERVQALGVPVYLHPRHSLPAVLRIYDGYPEITSAAWGFGVETGTHAIRLILGGVFDRYPGVQLVLGHLGETLPFAIGRLEHRVNLRPHGRTLERPISQYLRENLFVTTSGHFSTRALQATIAELGADRVLFAVDYPYESMEQGAGWFDSAPLDDGDRERIGRTNAEQLLRL